MVSSVPLIEKLTKASKDYYEGLPEDIAMSGGSLVEPVIEVMLDNKAKEDRQYQANQKIIEQLLAQ